MPLKGAMLQMTSANKQMLLYAIRLIFLLCFFFVVFETRSC